MRKTRKTHGGESVFDQFMDPIETPTIPITVPHNTEAFNAAIQANIAAADAIKYAIKSLTNTINNLNSAPPDIQSIFAKDIEKMIIARDQQYVSYKEVLTSCKTLKIEHKKNEILLSYGPTFIATYGTAYLDSLLDEYKLELDHEEEEELHQVFL
jgi:hypothetical protein